MVKEKMRKMTREGRRIVMILMMAVLVMHFVEDAKNESYQNHMSNIQLEMNSKTNILNQMLMGVEENAKQVSTFIEYLMINSENSDTLSEVIQQYLQMHTSFRDQNIIVVLRDSKTGFDQMTQFNDLNHDGKFETSSTQNFKQIGMGKTEYEQFEHIFRYGQPLWSQVIAVESGFENGKPVVIYAVPITIEKNIGFVGIIVQMDEIISQMSSPLEEGYFAILDKNMAVVYHPSFKSNTDMTKAYNGQFKEMVSMIKKSSGSGIIHYHWVDQRPKTLVHEYLLNGWNLNFAAFDAQFLELDSESYLEISLLILILIGIVVVVEFREKHLMAYFKKVLNDAVETLKGRENLKAIQDEIRESYLEPFIQVRQAFDDEILSLSELNLQIQRKNETLLKQHKDNGDVVDHLELALSMSAEKEAEQIEIIKHLQHRNQMAVTILGRLLKINRKSQYSTMGSKDLGNTIRILVDMLQTGIESTTLEPETRILLSDPIEAIRSAIDEIQQVEPKNKERDKAFTAKDSDEWQMVLKEFFSPLLEKAHIKCYWMFSDQSHFNDDILFIAAIDFIMIALHGVVENPENGHLVIKTGETQDGMQLLMQEDGIMKENARNECLDHLGRLVENNETMHMVIDTLLEGQAIQLIKRT